MVTIAFWLLLIVFGSLQAMQISPLPSVGISHRVTGNTQITYAFEQVDAAAITVTSTVSFGDSWDETSKNPPTVTLVGFAAQPGEMPNILSLTWYKQTAGWFADWELGLSGATIGNSVNLPEPVRVRPEKGHTYQATLSYDTKSGMVAALVLDTTTGEILLTAGVTTQPYQGYLYLAAAVDNPGAGQQSSVVFENLGLITQYLPVADNWTTGIKLGVSFLPTWTHDLNDQSYLLLNTPNPAIPGGKYVLSLQHGVTNQKLAEFRPVQGENLVQLPLEKLPVGKSFLRLEYISGSNVALFDQHEIVVGKVTFTFNQLQHNRSNEFINGMLTVQGNGQLPPVPVKISATIYENRWDQVTRRYHKIMHSQQTVYDGLVNVNGNTHMQPVPFMVGVPVEPGMWEMTLQASSSLDIAVNTIESSFAFTTYQPADLSEDKPFSIAVLPDSQLYTASNYLNPLFTRQTQWIAEHAVEKNIGLVVHLGDITNANSPVEWMAATQSMKVLDGVVPYVLAVGNHDIFVGGPNWVPGASLINQYFPIKSFPGLAGTFERDRIDNAYYTYRFGNTDYLIMSLEFSPRDAVLAWADQVVAAYPNHKVIIVTHAYLLPNGTRVTEPFLHPGTNDSHAIWDRLVRRHKNILMVLSGHCPAENMAINFDLGVNHNVVYELLFDYQSQANGGNGWLGMLEFKPDNTLNVGVYSPYLDEFKSGFDRYGFAGKYTIPIGKIPVAVP